MQPAAAMGTFLRVWRSEWAKLSRAQLANAIQRHQNGHRTVTRGAIRWWEAGQPPGNSEELEALLLVMRAHGLTQEEVEHFRTVVFAACANRQYPEMFGGDTAPDKRDLAAVLGRARYLRYSAAMPPTVPATAYIRELTGSVAEPDGPGDARADRMRQEALYHLHCVMASKHTIAGRYALASDACAAAGRIAARLCGPLGRLEGQSDHDWLEWRHAALGLKLYATNRGSRPWVHDPNNGMVPAGETAPDSRRICLQFMQLSEEAEAIGSRYVTLRSTVAGAQPWFLGEAPWTECHERVERMLAESEVLWDPADAHNMVFTALAAGGSVAGALEHLEQFTSWEHDDPLHQCKWHQALGDLAASSGAYGEAIAHYERGLAMPQHDHTRWYEDQFTKSVEACERARKGS